MNKVLVLILLGLIFSLLSGLIFAYGEIKLTPPLNWQPAPFNNSTGMIWFQNSTKSMFGILKLPENVSFPLILVGPIMSQFFADSIGIRRSDIIWSKQLWL